MILGITLKPPHPHGQRTGQGGRPRRLGPPGPQHHGQAAEGLGGQGGTARADPDREPTRRSGEGESRQGSPWRVRQRLSRLLRRPAGVVADFETELATAARCFTDDFEACIAHLRMPVTHRRAIRTTDEIDTSSVACRLLPNPSRAVRVMSIRPSCRSLPSSQITTSPKVQANLADAAQQIYGALVEAEVVYRPGNLAALDEEYAVTC